MTNQTFKDLKIGSSQKTFIIAEAGINHNGSIDLAFKMVEEAEKAGAGAIKFQTYKTEKRVAKDNPIYSILKKCELPQDEQKKIKEYADKIGIIFFSTPFDEYSVDFLKNINVSLMKIASFDIVNKKLLNKAAETKIPTIISRGMADKNEIDQAARIFEARHTEFALLHCVSAYPAPKEAVNLRIINSLKKLYSCPVGFSDHTLGIDASVYAVAAGAKIIEKHFTLDKNMDGPDHKMSVDPDDLTAMREKIEELEIMLGSGEIKQLLEEEAIKIFRRPSEI